MLQDILDASTINEWHNLIDHARTITICAHSSPDGDAVGSSLGLKDYLQARGKTVNIVFPNVFPDFLRWLPGTQEIIFFSTHTDKASQAIGQSDLIICLDFNDLSRIGALGECIASRNCPFILIDHHLDPKLPAEICISHPEMCATSEIIFHLIWQLGGYETLSKNAAIAIYTGMMTDTGGFTYNSTRSEIYFIISELLKKGIDKDKIYRKVFNNYSRDRIKLMGYVLFKNLRFYRGLRAAVFTLTKEEMMRFHFLRGDAEGFVNMPLSVRGTLLSISLREDTERPVIRVSLRSVDDFPCNKMAEEFFNGGGHLNASGGELPAPIEEAMKVVDRAVEAYRPLLEIR